MVLPVLVVSMLADLRGEQARRLSTQRKNRFRLTSVTEDAVCDWCVPAGMCPGWMYPRWMYPGWDYPGVRPVMT
jgi:hypothetical protein